MTKTFRSLALCGAFALGQLGGALQPLALAETVEKEDARNPKITPGDIVSITVYPAEEYNKEVMVQPDGKIELALLGSIAVKDLTTRQLQQLLEVRYSKYVDNPKVTVNVRHFAGRRVAVIGEIRSPGFYEYRDGMKMLELVAQAGGLADTARASKVTILREGEKDGMRVNFQAVLDGDVTRDVALRPGDTIYIPKTILNKKSTWISNNILPYLTLSTLIASLVILSRQ